MKPGVIVRVKPEYATGKNGIALVTMGVDPKASHVILEVTMFLGRPFLVLDARPTKWMPARWFEDTTYMLSETDV